jgi:predicted DCC family thiol-disulfide oxidoreductase YuxK
MIKEKDIVLFDGVCNLCNSSVQFIIKRDSKLKFKFASLQSTVGQSLLVKYNLPTKEFNTLVLIRGNECFLKSSAVLQILRELDGGFKILYLFRYIPRPLRDLIYDSIAKSRYKVFGKRHSCLIPTPELSQRFLA